MTITKFVHSCLLVSENNKNIIIDPGQFSYDSKILDVSKLPPIDVCVITHEHFDHFYLPAIKHICSHSPDVVFVSTKSVINQLIAAGYTNTTTESIPDVDIFSKEKHSELTWTVAPENIAVHLFGKVTHPGDRHDITETKDVLALPVTAPWGSMVDATKLAMRLKPKHIIPIHDWHWNEQARSGAYTTLQSLFEDNNIKFIALQNNVQITL